MNTRLSYRYADKTNCRQYTSIVVAGTLTWEQIEPYLARQRSFIPGQVGLEDLQYRFALPGADQPWHQIAPEDLRPTEAAPTVALTGDELAMRFAQTTWEVGGPMSPAAASAPRWPGAAARGQASPADDLSDGQGGSASTRRTSFRRTKPS